MKCSTCGSRATKRGEIKYCGHCKASLCFVCWLIHTGKINVFVLAVPSIPVIGDPEMN